MKLEIKVDSRIEGEHNRSSRHGKTVNGNASEVKFAETKKTVDS